MEVSGLTVIWLSKQVVDLVEWGGDPIGVWVGELWGVSGPSWFKGSTTSCKVVSTSSSQSPTSTESSATGRYFFLYSLLGNSGMIGNPPIFFTYALVCLLISLTISLPTEYRCSLSSGIGLWNPLLSDCYLWNNVGKTGLLGHPYTGGPPYSTKTVEAWKFTGINSKGFSPVNVPN